MSLCDWAIAVLREDPDSFLTAAEIGRRAEGRPLGHDALIRYERVCLTLVDNDMAWPLNDPIGPRSYRSRVQTEPLVW